MISAPTLSLKSMSLDYKRKKTWKREMLFSCLLQRAENGVGILITPTQGFISQRKGKDNDGTERVILSPQKAKTCFTTTILQQV